MAKILKQVAKDMADAFTRWNLWKGGGGGSTTLADLTDIELSNLQNDDILKYDNTLQKWRNSVLNYANIYSEVELVIGEWIDGKPLYRKVITIDTFTIRNTATSVYITNTNLSNDCIIRRMSGGACRNASDGYYPFNYFHDTNQYLFIKQVTLNNFEIAGKLPTTSSMLNGILILEYTKSTD